MRPKRIVDPQVVFNDGMRRFLLVPTVAAALALAAPSSSSARVVEIGGNLDNVSPSCPSTPCLAVTRTTGFQVAARDVRNPFVATTLGRVVAITLKLGKPSTSQTAFFDRQSGGTAKVRVAVLRPAPGSTATAPQYVLNSQTTDLNVVPYFGTTVQLPLSQTLLVRRGYIVAVTVPTWAPILAVSGLNDTYSWRASRVAPCTTNTESQMPHTLAGSSRRYSCLYKPARLTYTATIISIPAAPAPSRTPTRR